MLGHYPQAAGDRRQGMRSGQPLLWDRRRVVARVDQHGGEIGGEILVDLEPQPRLRRDYAAPGASGTTRSRARSAAYPIEALM